MRLPPRPRLRHGRDRGRDRKRRPLSCEHARAATTDALEKNSPPAALAHRSDVSVVIPTVLGGAPLLALVRALVTDDGARAEVMIADNGMPDGTANALRRLGAEVVPMGRNLGFGAAVNRLARFAQGESLIVLNDDISPQGAFLGRLVEPLKTGADAVAGVLIRSDQPERIESAGIVIDSALGPHDYLSDEPVARLEEPLPPPLGPCGGAALYRRPVFLDVGGFDETFFAYGEDVDLALRLRMAGARCALAPRARAVHIGSRTLGYHSLEKAALVGFARGHLLRKYGVLRRPGPALQAVGAELAASLLLTRRHRSLRPAVARARGWQASNRRAPYPAYSAITVGFNAGLQRRYTRSMRHGAWPRYAKISTKLSSTRRQEPCSKTMLNARGWVDVT